jgi:hypothetical protein
MTVVRKLMTVAFASGGSFLRSKKTVQLIFVRLLADFVGMASPLQRSHIFAVDALLKPQYQHLFGARRHQKRLEAVEECSWSIVGEGLKEREKAFIED